jgi:putative ABC transport system permease protein
MTFRDLKLRVRALIARRRVERELGDEISFHIERETQKHIASGLSPAEARTRALARFGSVALAADHCRDARGTAYVDGCVRDILYAVRTFRRAPLAALTIVTTVALGLGLVAAVFTFFNVLVFRVDAVPNPAELFSVERPQTRDGERVRFTRPQYDALRRETSVFSDAFAELSDIDSRIDGRMMAGTLVTGNFFHVLGVNAALGRTLTPADDERFAPRPVMVLSHRGWSRLFASDTAVIGRSLLVNGFPYEIVGVMPEGFRGLSVGPPDYWAPLSLVGQVRPIHAGKEDNVGIDIIGRLKPGLSRRTATAGLVVWDAGRTDGVPAERRTANITLEPRQGTVPQPVEALLLFTPLFFAFGLILMIGCANVANLLLARAVSRQREIGIRLSLGASRRRIIRQLLTESLLLALASAALGFAISRVVLEATIYAVTSTMAPELAEIVRLSAPAADWRVLMFLLSGGIASTVFFGLAPALQATRLELVRTMRGELTRDSRPGRARNALIGVQVGASALLLICAAVFLRSALAASTVDPGVRTADTVIVEIVNEPFRGAMVQAVMAEPSVAAVAASSPDPLSRPRVAFAEISASAGPAADRPAGKSTVAYKFVSPEYFEVLGIRVSRGRGFTQAERTGDAAVAVVSESTARQLWPNADAVGQVLRLEADPNSETPRRDEPALPSRTFTVVGVTRDVAVFRLAQFKDAGVYLPTNAAIAKTSLTVRVHGDPEQARRALLQRLTTIDPNMGLVLTMRTVARMETYFLQIAFWLTFGLGGLALVLTLSGLFSVLSYVVAQRTKEIGVRMALGATTRNVVGLVLSQSLRPVVVGLVAGGGLAAALAIVLMSTPAAAQIGTIVHVFDPVAYAASLLFIVSACVLAAWAPAWRAARIDPIATLRND